MIVIALLMKNRTIILLQYITIASINKSSSSYEYTNPSSRNLARRSSAVLEPSCIKFISNCFLELSAAAVSLFVFHKLQPPNLVWWKQRTATYILTLSSPPWTSKRAYQSRIVINASSNIFLTSGFINKFSCRPS